MRVMIKKSVAREICRYWGFPCVLKANPHHDARGRFAAGAGEPVPTGRGDFGDIYECFKGKPNEAIKFLLEKKGGEAVGALHHKDVGDIDLVWGKEGRGHSDGYGLAKLARFHPEVLGDLQGILDGMSVVSRTENRAVLESEKHEASVRLSWNGKSKKWLLTAYEKEGGVSDSTTDIARTESSRKNDTATLANTTKGSIAQDDKKATKKSVWSPRLVVKKSVACEICKANPHHDVRGRFASVDVAHAGEYVLTRSGSKDFGEITQEIADSIGRQAGKIRLRRGIEHERDKKGGYGEKHIEREGRKQQLEKAGYANARDFVEDVCKNFNKVYQNGGGLLLVKETGRLVCAIGMESSKDGNFYDVKTAHIAREGYYKKKRLLWESPSNLHKSESSKAPTLKSSYATPRAFSEYPDAHMIPQSAKNASEKSKKISKNHPRLVVRKSVAREICRFWGLPLIQKSNPHHDARGRFAVGKAAQTDKDDVFDVEEISDLEFESPTKSFKLKPLGDKFFEATKTQKKPLLLKQNILRKNKIHHPEISTAKVSKNILSQALYGNNVVMLCKPNDKPNYWSVVKEGSDYYVAVVDTDPAKKYNEIVGWRKIDEKKYAAMKRRVREEDGQLLITEEISDSSIRAADLSALPPDGANIPRVLKKSSATRQSRLVVRKTCRQSKRATAPMPTEVSPKLTSKTVTAHGHSIPQGKRNASDKSTHPRLVVQKGAARQVLRKGNTHHDTLGRFASVQECKVKSPYEGVNMDGLRSAFDEKTNRYIGKRITNKATGRSVVFSKTSQKDVRSHTKNSVEVNGFTPYEHFEVANQVLELFQNATLENEHADTKHNRSDLRIERFLSQPVTLKSGREVQACITVKHSLNPDGRRIYAIEAMEIKEALEKTRAKGRQLNKSEDPSSEKSIPHPTKNASKKSLRPRFMVRKSVARQILRQEHRWAGCGGYAKRRAPTTTEEGRHFRAVSGGSYP